MTVYAVVQWKDRNGNFASPEQKLSLKSLLGEAQYNYIFGVPSTEPRSRKNHQHVLWHIDTISDQEPVRQDACKAYFLPQASQLQWQHVRWPKTINIRG
jgi:hypothetical protein